MHPSPPTMTSLSELHIAPHPSSLLTSLDLISPPTPSALKHNSALPPIVSLDASHSPDNHPHSEPSPESTMRHTPASSRGNSAPNTPPLSILTPEDKDVFRLPAVEALRLMARSIEVLVSFTGDIPPTPPLSHPNSPALSAIDDKGLQTPSESPNMDASTLNNSGFSFGSQNSCDLDGVKVKKNSKPTQEEEGKFIAAGVDNAIQYGAITRKFWSKSVPEIPIEDYIFRIHRFCPMSTAVYIAASVYLHRLAVVDRILPITRYNVHRLVLASLRIASKACEDLSHSHKRFAKVGGLSENELSRLEVSFCFLVNFELQISKSTMERQVAALRNIAATQVLMGKPALQPRMPKDMQYRSTPVYVDC